MTEQLTLPPPQRLHRSVCECGHSPPDYLGAVGDQFSQFLVEEGAVLGCSVVSDSL